MSSKTKRADAPKRLKSQNEIAITNQQFDSFIKACETVPMPSKKMVEAANRLDSEGF